MRRSATRAAGPGRNIEGVTSWGLLGVRGVPERVSPAQRVWVDGARSRAPLGDGAAVRTRTPLGVPSVLRTSGEWTGAVHAGLSTMLFTTGAALGAGHRSGSRRTKVN